MPDQEQEKQDFVAERSETPDSALSTASEKKQRAAKKFTAKSAMETAVNPSDPIPVNESLSKTAPDQPNPAKKEGGKGKGVRIVVDGREFGIQNESAIRTLVGQMTRVARNFDENDGQKLQGALAMARDIAPRDALEGMLTTQMIGVHSLGNEMYESSVASKSNA